MHRSYIFSFDILYSIIFLIFLFQFFYIAHFISNHDRTKINSNMTFWHIKTSLQVFKLELEKLYNNIINIPTDIFIKQHWFAAQTLYWQKICTQFFIKPNSDIFNITDTSKQHVCTKNAHVYVSLTCECMFCFIDMLGIVLRTITRFFVVNIIYG